MSKITMCLDPLDSNNSPVSNTKTYKADNSKESYGNTYKTIMVEKSINNITELKTTITDTIKGNGFLILGSPIKHNKTHQLRRHKVENFGEDGVTIKGNQAGVLVLDIDEHTNKFRFSDPRHIEYVIEQLNEMIPGVEDTSFIWQFSSGAGIGDPYQTKAHIFFLIEPISFPQIHALMNNLNDMNKIKLDGATARIHQPIYIAPPIFEDKCLDPQINQRIQTVKAQNKVLKLDENLLIVPKKEEEQKQQNPSSNEVMDVLSFHKTNAEKAFESDSDSIKGMGKYIRTLYEYDYSKVVVEELWESFYPGSNYTLVASTKSKPHNYTIFNDTWKYLEMQGKALKTSYDNIDSRTVKVSTDSRLKSKGFCIIESYYTDSYNELRVKLKESKIRNSFDFMPRVEFHLSEKVTLKTREYLIYYIKQNNLRWRIT